ncbi:DUF2397 family protein [Streptomyces sp. DSM 42041]|uniref:DUF2397 family protein n=1 Tax=Streptomyces hazeniae TaxID=3075538 RepID=A0ABU2NMU6_9ACTN|nr:DUF2397 family protein [Streptomyces sp. DSM 42041]MDT0378309.1 DUF2397 family protein [Streptomyces sp. DSM 42041]
MPGGPDAAVPARPADHAPFAHLTEPNAVLHRAAMRARSSLPRSGSRCICGRRDVHAGMAAGSRPTDPEAVMKALDALVGWGNLRADPDTSRVTAVENFCRKRFIYQLTRAGEATEARCRLSPKPSPLHACRRDGRERMAVWTVTR